ncbi:hypothetical protein BH09PLA1_BH09PLA1_19590 [soil metagenome]
MWGGGVGRRILGLRGVPLRPGVARGRGRMWSEPKREGARAQGRGPRKTKQSQRAKDLRSSQTVAGPRDGEIVLENEVRNDDRIWRNKAKERLGHGGAADTEKYQVTVFVFSVLSVTLWQILHFCGFCTSSSTACEVLAEGAGRLAECFADAGQGLAEARFVPASATCGERTGLRIRIRIARCGQSHDFFAVIVTAGWANAVDARSAPDRSLTTGWEGRRGNRRKWCADNGKILTILPFWAYWPHHPARSLNDSASKSDHQRIYVDLPASTIRIPNGANRWDRT